MKEIIRYLGSFINSYQSHNIDDLPCNHKKMMRNPCIFKPETVEVLVKVNYKTFPLFRVDYMIFDDDRWKWGRNFGITHWMLIPKLPE